MTHQIGNACQGLFKLVNNVWSNPTAASPTAMGAALFQSSPNSIRRWTQWQFIEIWWLAGIGHDAGHLFSANLDLGRRGRRRWQGSHRLHPNGAGPALCSATRCRSSTLTQMYRGEAPTIHIARRRSRLGEGIRRQHPADATTRFTATYRSTSGRSIPTDLGCDQSSWLVTMISVCCVTRQGTASTGHAAGSVHAISRHIQLMITTILAKIEPTRCLY
mmetsp:Transcript_28180/g.81507  ORF Transcript_28180/g.81507 Transcript_28180/m.81507 type:complete len:218 (-) Transcript_28180:689-1342(-)